MVDKDGRNAMPNDVRDAIIERMMEQYGTAVYRMCYVYLRNQSLAEDAGQEAFIKAYRNLDSFEGKHGNSEKAWLMRIAINTCKDYQRSNWFRNLYKTKALDELPESAYQADEHDRTVTEEIMQLPTKLKEIVLLYYYQDMTYDEIALALGVSKTTVFQRLKKAKHLLKTKLEGWIDDD